MFPQCFPVFPYEKHCSRKPKIYFCRVAETYFAPEDNACGIWVSEKIRTRSAYQSHTEPPPPRPPPPIYIGSAIKQSEGFASKATKVFQFQTE